MAFEVRTQHSLPEELLRIWQEELHFAILQLSKKRDVEVGIHQARKSLKRCRALLRLVRRPLGNEKYWQANVCYRDAARRVSELRDLAAMQETLVSIRTKSKRKSLQDCVSLAELQLAQWQKRAVAEMKGQDDQRILSVTELTVGVEHLSAWDQAEDHFSWIASSFQKMYAQGQERMALALQNPDTHRLHDWRKRVKYLWHHIQLLHNCWPQTLDPLAEEFHRLADLLGDDHDLAVLEELIQSGRLLRGRVKGKAEFLQLIHVQRLALSQAFFPLGKKLFFAQPETFTNQIANSWQVWREQYPVMIENPSRIVNS